MGIEVVEVREDFRVFLGRLDDLLDLVQVVGIVHRGAVDDGILAQVVAAHRHQRAVGRVDVQPLREEQIDLVDVLLERGVAGRVVLHVVGGAQTFAGVEGNFGGLAVGLAARRALAFAPRSRGLAVGQCLVVVLGDGQQQLRQLLVAQDVEDKAGQHQRGKHGRRRRECGAGASSAFVAGRKIFVYRA